MIVIEFLIKFLYMWYLLLTAFMEFLFENVMRLVSWFEVFLGKGVV